MSFGLSNFRSPKEGNICYINAILHLLNSVSLIRNLVKKKGYKAQTSSVTPICDEVSRIFNYEGGVTSAAALRQLLGTKENLSFVLNQQQEDAAELMGKLLDLIVEESDVEVGLEKLIQISVARQPSCDTTDGRCSTCGYGSHPLEDSGNILELGGNPGFARLQDLIDSYFEDKEIEWRCSNDGHCKDADSRLYKPGKMRQAVTRCDKM